jgi:hypothetical protein
MQIHALKLPLSFKCAENLKNNYYLYSGHRNCLLFTRHFIWTRKLPKSSVRKMMAIEVDCISYLSRKLCNSEVQDVNCGSANKSVTLPQFTSCTVFLSYNFLDKCKMQSTSIELLSNMFEKLYAL